MRSDCARRLRTGSPRTRKASDAHAVSAMSAHLGERCAIFVTRALSAAGDYLDTLSRQWDRRLDRLRAFVERD